MTRAIALILSCLACLAGAAWAGPVGAETIRVAGTGGPLEAMRLAGEAFQKTHPQTNVAIVPGLGSRGGIRALQAGAVDIAVSASPAPAAEPGLKSVELGRTPIIFTTASPRPGAGVTMAGLVEIYSGRKTAWPDGSRLRVILRPNGDSDTVFLRALSPAIARSPMPRGSSSPTTCLPRSRTASRGTPGESVRCCSTWSATPSSSPSAAKWRCSSRPASRAPMASS